MRIATRRACFLCLFVMLHAPAPATADADTRLATARNLFEKFVALGNRFDASVSDLYHDDARIVAYRTYPFGRERRLTMRGKRYKSIIRGVMPLARMRDDRSEYFDVSYAPEGSGVRISATRRSLLKGYAAPHSILMAPDDSGAWRIHEEVIRTRP